MNIEELNKILNDLADLDLCDGKSIDDHPCSVAVRAINQMREDIEILSAACSSGVKSNRAKVLIRSEYNPQF